MERRVEWKMDCCEDECDCRGTGCSPVARTRIAPAGGGFVQVVRFVRIRQFVGGRCREMERRVEWKMDCCEDERVKREVWEGVGIMREREG